MFTVSEDYPWLSLLTVLWGVTRQTVGHKVQWRAKYNGLGQMWIRSFHWTSFRGLNIHSLKQTGKLLRTVDWRATTENNINQFYFDQKHVFLQEKLFIQNTTYFDSLTLQCQLQCTSQTCKPWHPAGFSALYNRECIQGLYNWKLPLLGSSWNSNFRITFIGLYMQSDFSKLQDLAYC